MIDERTRSELVLVGSLISSEWVSIGSRPFSPVDHPHLARLEVEASDWISDPHLRTIARCVHRMRDRGSTIDSGSISKAVGCQSWSVDDLVARARECALSPDLANFDAEEFCQRFPRIVSDDSEHGTRCLWDIPNPPEFDDPNELIKHRYLCRRGGMLLVAPSGVGKSVFALQCAIQWSLGLQAFGLQPARPLRMLIVQAENDDGDIAEMRDGIIDNITIPVGTDKSGAKNIWILQETSRSGPDFFSNVLGPALSEWKPDIVVIDPALAYIGGDASDQTDVGRFLRNGLNPLLIAHDCAAMVVHHTTKPPRGADKTGWSTGDFAYAGSGSAEWANWSRAVLCIRSIGSHEVYELVAGKRGSRLRWRDESGEREYVRLIRHSRGHGIAWVDADESDRPQSTSDGSRSSPSSPIDIMMYLSPDGMRYGEWLRAVSDATGCSKSSFARRVSDARSQDRVLLSKIDNRYKPVLKSNGVHSNAQGGSGYD